MSQIVTIHMFDTWRVRDFQLLFGFVAHELACASFLAFRTTFSVQVVALCAVVCVATTVSRILLHACASGCPHVMLQHVARAIIGCGVIFVKNHRALLCELGAHMSA